MSKKIRSIPSPYDKRVDQLRAEMDRRKLNGYLILNRMDQFWLTGFTGEDGMVLVTPGAVVLISDGRFDEAADKEAPWATKIMRTVRTPEQNAKEINRYRLKKVGFEPGHMTVAEFTGLRKHLRSTSLVSAGGVVRAMRELKDAGEVVAIREAIRVAEKAFDKVVKWLKPGKTERQIAARLAYEMQVLGAQEVSFPSIVAVGANGSLPHYEAGDAVVQKDQGVLIDWGARVGWYCSDLTRMVWPGSIPRKIREIHDVVRDSHDAAIAAIKPGMRAEALDRVARRVIEKAGFGDRFNHALGHGMGLDVHEAPRLGKKSVDVIKPGMVFTIEPGIYLPGHGGVRIESDVLVTETGYEVLTTYPY